MTTLIDTFMPKKLLQSQCNAALDTLCKSARSTDPGSDSEGPKTTAQAGLQALFQLSALKKSTKAQTRICEAALSRSAQRSVEQEGRICSLSTEVVELEKQLNTLSQELNHTLKSLAVERSAVSHLQNTEESLNTNITRITKAHKFLETELANAMTAYSTSDSTQLAQLNATTVALKAQVDALRAECSLSKATLVEATRATTDEQAAHKVTREELSKAQIESATLSTSLEVLQEEQKALQLAFCAASEKATKEYKITAQYSAKIVELLAEVKEKDDSLKTLQTTHHTMKYAHKVLLDSRAIFQTSIARSNKALAASNSTLIDANKRYGALKTKLSEALSENAKLKADAREWESFFATVNTPRKKAKARSVTSTPIKTALGDKENVLEA
ncbi:unnamed protein product [Somion occarium]|uniref:Uncharacterized protein n=1 Tax=Somion occarium TaxID=3059160 RepID=A0ABP1E631_9APHY